MGTHLKLLTAVLVLVNSAQDGDNLTIGGQGDGAGNASAGALDGFDDPLRCGIDQLSIVALQTNSDFFLDCHGNASFINFCGGTINTCTPHRVFHAFALQNPVNRTQFSRKETSAN